MLAIASGASAEFAPLMALTSPGKRVYAACWQHEYVELLFPPGHLEQEEYVRDILARADIEWMWWTDADLLITNHQINIATLRDEQADIIWVKDWYGLNNGSVLYHNTPATREFVDTCKAERNLIHPEELELSKRIWPGAFQGWDHEKTNQGVATAVAARMWQAGNLRVKWIQQRALNAYMLAEHRLDIDYHFKRHQWDTGGWQCGDLALHLAAQNMETRLRVFNQVLPMVVPFVPGCSGESNLKYPGGRP